MWLRWVLWLRVSQSATIKLWPGLHHKARLGGRESSSKLTHLVVGGIHFFMGCGTEPALSFCHMSLSTEQPTAGQLASAEEEEKRA